MKFDPAKNYQKVRVYGAGVRYHQNGCEYTSGFKLIGEIGMTPKDVKVKEDKKEQAKAKKKNSRDEIRARAAEKLAGFKTPETTDAISEALNENAAAAAAEINA